MRNLRIYSVSFRENMRNSRIYSFSSERTCAIHASTQFPQREHAHFANLLNFLSDNFKVEAAQIASLLKIKKPTLGIPSPFHQKTTELSLF